MLAHEVTPLADSCPRWGEKFVTSRRTQRMHLFPRPAC
jgi:hypothetical protein